MQMKTMTSCRVGSRHVRARKPCQDRCRIVTVKDRHIFIIADGHGHRSHCRSVPAAVIACSVAAKTLGDLDIPFEQAPKIIKEQFDKKVAMHMLRHPFSFQERQLLYGYPLEAAYGTTLLACVVCPQGTFLLRLGDGEIHALKSDGTFYPAVKGKLVSSMYSPDAADQMETAFYPEPAAAIMMFSDGFRNAEEHPTSLLRLLEQPQANAISEDVLQAGDCGDDQTVILAIDRQLAADPEFQAALQEQRNRTAARQEAARLSGEMHRCKVVIRGLAGKLAAVDPEGKDWDRVLSQLLREGAEYASVQQRHNDLFEGGA